MGASAQAFYQALANAGGGLDFSAMIGFLDGTIDDVTG